MIEMGVEELAEAMVSDPKSWAGMFIELQQSNEKLITMNNAMAATIEANIAMDKKTRRGQ